MPVVRVDHLGPPAGVEPFGDPRRHGAQHREATVTRSVLFSGVHVRTGASLDQAVVLPDVDVGPGARLTRVVIERRCEIPAGMVIGEDAEADARRFHRTEKGVVLVTREMLAAL